MSNPNIPIPPRGKQDSTPATSSSDKNAGLVRPALLIFGALVLLLGVGTAAVLGLTTAAIVGAGYYLLSGSSSSSSESISAPAESASKSTPITTNNHHTDLKREANGHTDDTMTDKANAASTASSHNLDNPEPHHPSINTQVPPTIKTPDEATAVPDPIESAKSFATASQTIATPTSALTTKTHKSTGSFSDDEVPLFMLDINAADRLDVSRGADDAPYPSASSNYFAAEGGDEDDEESGSGGFILSKPVKGGFHHAPYSAYDEDGKGKELVLPSGSPPAVSPYPTEEELLQRQQEQPPVPESVEETGQTLLAPSLPEINILSPNTTQRVIQRENASGPANLTLSLDPRPSIAPRASSTLSTATSTTLSATSDDNTTPLILLDVPQFTLPGQGPSEDQMLYPSPSSALMEDFAHDPSDLVESSIDSPANKDQFGFIPDGVLKAGNLDDYMRKVLEVPPQELLKQRRAKSASALKEGFGDSLPPAFRRSSITPGGEYDTALSDHESAGGSGEKKKGRFASLRQKLGRGKDSDPGSGEGSDTEGAAEAREGRQGKGVLDRVRKVSESLRNRSRSRSASRTRKSGLSKESTEEVQAPRAEGE